jgi:FMN hydrolase / 5-amino-6-(5-phospho-D-ribitylamino)uracil phosphatase
MRVELYDDVRPALAFLAARFPTVALTNGNADVHRVGLGEFFVGSFSAQAFGVGKPDVRIFHAAASDMLASEKKGCTNCSPTQVLV